jgi:uncharacterized protein YjbI with pentapeptide repeats
MDLTSTDLSGADLSRADFSGMTLVKANLSGADFRGTIALMIGIGRFSGVS